MVTQYLGVTVPWHPDHVVSDSDVIPPRGGHVSTLPIPGTKLFRVHTEMHMPLVEIDWDLNVNHGAN